MQTVLERIAHGDERAVEQCIDQYGNLVWSIARRLDGGARDTEDAVQEIFVDLWKSAQRFRPERASEPTFVAMIARRRMIDRLRRAGRRLTTSPLTDETDVASDHHERLELGAEASLAMRAVQSLRPEQRDVVLLSVVHGMPHGEIAKRTSLPLGTVKSFIRRGLSTVREQLRSATPLNVDGLAEGEVSS